MKLFECQNCGQVLYFENTSCESCALRLGYLPERETLSALEEADGGWRALAAPGEHFRFCANAGHGVCNWLVSSASPEAFCAACRHNRTIPDLAAPGNLEHWRKLEFAKHRLFYTLLRLRLPLTTRGEDPDGLAFDFLSGLGTAPAGAAPVLTGHAGGLITLNVEEADDPERERRRKSMGEPYRTLLGHFRHEIAHYYWDHLVAATAAIDEFREMFGDERADYASVLRPGARNSRQNPGVGVEYDEEVRMAQNQPTGYFGALLGGLVAVFAIVFMLSGGEWTGNKKIGGDEDLPPVVAAPVPKQ